MVHCVAAAAAYFVLTAPLISKVLHLVLVCDVPAVAEHRTAY
jgi:hypothetical protein